MMLYPMPILGATAPVTPAGAAVVNNAEILGAVTAIQLAHPGARLIHAGGPDRPLHAHRRLLRQRARGAAAARPPGQMARFYGLPAGLGWGGTKDKEPGPSPAYENTLGMMLELFAGADFLFGAGLLDSVTQMSLEELVWPTRCSAWSAGCCAASRSTASTLAVELIKKLGFKGDYLFAPHTRAHVRELWQAKLGETGTYEGWQNAARSPRLEVTSCAPHRRRRLGREFHRHPPRRVPRRSSAASSMTSSPRSSPRRFSP
jgi:trimethylamine--corrinoid protein Co-methyltransferase